MKTKLLLLGIICIGALQSVLAQEVTSNKQEITSANWTSGRADGHAPIGVMGDHVHHKGEWMFSYRYMNMNMHGNISGTDEVSLETVFTDYTVAPQTMTMQMHMVGLMYAPSDKITLFAMGNIVDNKMSLITKMKMNFQTNASGFGDLKIGALYQIFNANRKTLHLNIGVSLPTGSLTETGVTPMSDPNETRLGYAMQLGSGTYDVNLGATYLKQYYNASFGIQSGYLLRTGENSEGYTLGDRWNTNFWAAYSFARSVSASIRVNYIAMQAIKGTDRTFMMPMMATVFDASNSGRQQLNISLGGNYAIFKGELKGMRLAVEFGIPVYQYVEGIQMESQFNFTLGIQYAFGGH